ncbi:hypothetical protein C0989_008873 [Termitomyces sp. Mn162]|nr:hypothetical protein C0989_008873 [Termitomyces sp. Mn162]
MEVARRQEEWLANEVALGQQGILCRLGLGALNPPRQSISSICVHPGWVVKDAQGSPAGVGAVCGANGALAGRALVEDYSGSQVMVEGGNGCGGATPRAPGGPGNGGGPVGGGHGGKNSGGRVGGGGRVR